MSKAVQFLYASDIVDRPFRLTPDPFSPVLEGEPCVCSHCSRMIEVGEHYEDSKVGQFFSDTRDLASSSRKICWRCVYLRSRTLMYGMAATVVTMDDVYPIARDVNKAWLFTDPPPAPFLVTHSSSTMQHLAWRTPMTLDNSLIHVRFGPDLFTGRPEYINRALAIADRLNEGEKQWRTPVYFDRKAQDSTHGLITSFGKERLSDAEAHFFNSSLSAGERWALAYLMHSRRPVPEKPEPTTQAILNKLLK